MESTGVVSLVVKNKVESILPMSEYAAFWKVIVEDDLDIIQALAELSNDREELTNSLLNIFEGTGGIPSVISLLTNLVKSDIKKTEDSHILFRSSSLVTKAVEKFLRRCGTNYLATTLRPVVQDILQEKESCEIDPTKLDSDHDIHANGERLLKHVRACWTAIFESLGNLPKSVDIYSYSSVLLF